VQTIDQTLEKRLVAQNQPPVSWGLLIAICAGALLGVLGANSAPFLIGAVVDGLGFSEFQAGTISSLEIVAAAVTGILIAPFINRISLVRLAITGGITASCLQFLSAVISDFQVMLAVRLLVGIALGLAFAAATAAAAATANPNRVLGSAVSMSFVFLVFIFFPGLGMAVELNSQQGAFIMLGVVALLSTVTFRWLGDGRREPAPISSDSVNPRKGLITLLLIIALFNLATGPIWAFTERIGVDIGMGHVRIGTILGFTGISGIAGAAIAARLSSRFGRTGPISLALALCGASALLLALGKSEWSFILGATLYFLGYSFLFPFLMGAGAAMDSSGRVVTAAAGFNQIVFAAGPAIGAVIAEFSSYEMIGVVGAMTCAAALLVLAMRGHLLGS